MGTPPLFASGSLFLLRLRATFLAYAEEESARIAKNKGDCDYERDRLYAEQLLREVDALRSERRQSRRMSRTQRSSHGSGIASGAESGVRQAGEPGGRAMSSLQ